MTHGWVNSMKKFLKDTQGAISILFVILGVIAIMLCSAFLDLMQRQWILQEAQSIMDTAGVTALHAGVDQQKLRIGEFDVNKSVVRGHYQGLVSQKFSNSDSIISYNLIRTDISTFTDNWGVGVSSKQHPQAMLVSYIMVTVPSTPVLDFSEGFTETFYNSRGNTTFTVSYQGQNNDGQHELILRSVTRVVYR